MPWQKIRRRRGRPSLMWGLRHDRDYLDLFDMLLLARTQPLRSYALAKEVAGWSDRDDPITVKRLGRKLKDLISRIPVPCETEEAKREEALKIVKDCIIWSNSLTLDEYRQFVAAHELINQVNARLKIAEDELDRHVQFIPLKSRKSANIK